ncbi:hypothetical protein BU16DRAFT_536251 [Lophium mytilinum]|uniref:Uncharacterized protein n=1 Tax=Lophium mytilinum TaxID=390894 RepID=A0A6A6R0E5_9PEZI|nr:hypothetical protein BU16DRAFT_536251 [Lophium mytilinum]
MADQESWVELDGKPVKPIQSGVSDQQQALDKTVDNDLLHQLPFELKEMVYEHTFPDKVVWADRKRITRKTLSFRHDGEKCSLGLLRTSITTKMMALPGLYAFAAFQVRIQSNAISFLGKRHINGGTIPSLEHVRNVHIILDVMKAPAFELDEPGRWEDKAALLRRKIQLAKLQQNVNTISQELKRCDAMRSLCVVLTENGHPPEDVYYTESVKTIVLPLNDMVPKTKVSILYSSEYGSMEYFLGYGRLTLTNLNIEAVREWLGS